MKRIHIILSISLLIGMIGCHKESDLVNKLSPEDKLAAEGMEEAFKTAQLYNDSLV
jgi:hypothetical protein